jgi:hypothetical protein
MNGLPSPLQRAPLSALISAALLLFGANLVRADVVNAFLAIPSADSIVWDFGDDVTIKLTLTNDNNDTIRADQYQQNLLTLIELWISGPKQDYHGVQGYSPLVILNTADGFNRNAGFNPATGTIEVRIPENEAGTGSYTALFKVVRRVNNRNTTKYVKADFRIGQSLRTRAAFNSWNNCRSCHTPSRHSTNDLSNCLVCHAKDYARPMQGIIHDIGAHPQVVGRCTNCHKAGAALTNFRRTACFSCHSVGNAPDGHADYADNQCGRCHDGNNSPYARHNIAVPTAPDAFNLTTPANGDTIDHADSICTVQFRWAASRVRDNNDILTYRLELAGNENFEDAMIWDSLPRTDFTVTPLDWQRNYWWRIRAEDLNSEGTWSNATFNFSTWWEDPPPPPENHPPSAFDLASPPDGAEENVDEVSAEIDFVWRQSIDPDSAAVVTYQLNLTLSGWTLLGGQETPIDTSIFVRDVSDTLVAVDFFDALPDIQQNQFILNISWMVLAMSEGDTVSSSDTFSYTLLRPSEAKSGDVPVPKAIRLLSIHPNPFNATTRIEFTLPVETEINVAILDLSGREIATVSQGRFLAGRYQAVWNSKDTPSGVYLCRMKAGSIEVSRKLVLVK